MRKNTEFCNALDAIEWYYQDGLLRQDNHIASQDLAENILSCASEQNCHWHFPVSALVEAIEQSREDARRYQDVV